MSTRIDIDAIVIASPCTVPWESMTGDEARRFCGQCRLHVHDFAQMTRAEIRELLAATGGNCCKRVWRRPDGRIITKDCNRVVRALRRRMRAFGNAAAALLALVGLGGCGSKADSNSPDAASAPAKAPVVPAAAEAVKPPESDAAVTTGR